jgi:hypothetical protein
MQQQQMLWGSLSHAQRSALLTALDQPGGQGQLQGSTVSNGSSSCNRWAHRRCISSFAPRPQMPQQR